MRNNNAMQYTAATYYQLDKKRWMSSALDCCCHYSAVQVSDADEAGARVQLRRVIKRNKET